MNEPCRIGLVGCGRWGRHILRDLVALGCQVFVVARSESSRKRASEGGATAVVETIEALPRVRGAVVATPTTAHGEAIERLLDRRIPIFVEKPLSSSLEEAERLVRRAADRLFVMDKWRYHPGVERLAEIARSRQLGAVVGLRTTRVGWGRDDVDVDVAWHLAPHDLAIAVEILGAIPEPRCAIAEWVGKTPVGLVGILGQHPWLMLEVSERRRKHFREIRLFCEHGVAVLPDSYSDHLAITRDNGFEPGEVPVVERWPIPTELPLFRELRAFVEHVMGGGPSRSQAREALAVVRTVARLRDLAGMA